MGPAFLEELVHGAPAGGCIQQFSGIRVIKIDFALDVLDILHKACFALKVSRMFCSNNS